MKRHSERETYFRITLLKVDVSRVDDLVPPVKKLFDEELFRRIGILRGRIFV